jgi:fucose permease
LTGGYAAFSIGLNGFIADISTPDQRAFRMGMIHLAQSLGRPLASPVGAYLLREGCFI